MRNGFYPVYSFSKELETVWIGIKACFMSKESPIV